MQTNKIKRVRSAVSFKQTRYSRLKATVKTQQNCISSDIFYNTFNDFIDKKQHAVQQKKQNELKFVIKRLPSSPSKLSVQQNIGFNQYNSKSWRTINSARSLNRLQSLKKCQQLDPIKLNLKQKVERIKSKHSANQIKSMALKINRNENPEKQIYKTKQETKMISSKIRQIITKWQSQKLNSIDAYKKKVKLFFKNPVDREKQRKKQQPIIWQIQ